MAARTRRLCGNEFGSEDKTRVSLAFKAASHVYSGDDPTFTFISQGVWLRLLPYSVWATAARDSSLCGTDLTGQSRI